MDVELVSRAQQGDLASFAVIARELGDRYLGVARRILRDLDLAEDATQQALFAIWHDLPGLRDPARFEAWAYRILVRACNDQGWRERRWAGQIRLFPTDDGRTPDLADSVADRDRLERAFRHLSMEYRTVVVLRHYLDLPLDRIAVICGIPSGTAHSRLHRAMQALRAAIEADERAASREAYG